MRPVIGLIDLLYWAPVPRKGSRGEAILAKSVLPQRKNPGRAGRSSQPQYNEATSGEESDTKTPPGSWKVSGRSRWLDWSTDLEERKVYGAELMSGHGILSSLWLVKTILMFTS